MNKYGLIQHLFLSAVYKIFSCRTFFAQLTILIFFQTLVCQPIWSANTENLLFGPEWTFTNQEVLSQGAYANDLYLKVIAKKIVHFCKKTGKCKIINESDLMREDFDTIKVKTRFGSEISFTTDIGVIEVTSTPLTFSQWKQQKSEFQELVFDLLDSMGLRPHEREGAGHLNVGLQYFADKPLLARNFLVDFLNHPGVGVVLNSLEANRLDSAYLYEWILMTSDPIGLVRISPNILDKRRHRINEIISTYNLLAIPLSLDEALNPFDSFINAKFVAIAVNDRNKSNLARFEIRALRPQANMSDFIKVIEIYKARIQYLEKIKTVLPLEKPYPTTDGWQALGEFASYLSESGLDWKKYRSLMPPPWRNLPEENFVYKEKKMNKDLNREKMCRYILLKK